ncbi:MAG: hypothetical protein KDK71_08580, partial [Chlamydiia bacterium]|nr:hypothetical protein [Chlamydiia bacterium]
MADHIHIASTRESNYREKTLEMMTDKGYANYVFYQVGEEIFAALRDRPLPVRRVDDNVQILTQQDLEKQILSQKSINQQQASAYKTASYTSRPNVPSREHQSKLGDKEKTKEKQGASNRRPPPDPPKDKIVKPEEKAKVTQKIEQPRDLLTILDEATKHSQNERSEKKFKQGNIDNLANDLEKLGKQFEEFFGHKKDSLKQSNDPQYREILEQKRKDLMIKIDELENRYPTCQNAILTLYTNLDREENIFSFYQERIIASEINRQLYFSFIISDMDKNHSKICERFFPNIPKDQHHLIKFSIVKEEAKAKPFLDGETHNEGKSPMLIRCTMNDQVLKDLVYKPRDGRMDQAVMSLFKEINNLSPHS